MYLWKVDALVEDLRDDRVTQREQFKYYLTVILLWTLYLHLFVAATTLAMQEAMQPTDGVAVSHGASYGVSDAIGAILHLGITALGIFICHKMNGIGDGIGFIARMFCLSIPVLVRTAVFVPIPATILWHVINESVSAGWLAPEVRIVLSIVTPPLIHTVAMYAYLATKIRKVSAL